MASKIVKNRTYLPENVRMGVEDFPETNAYRDMFEAVSGRVLGRNNWLLDQEASIQVATIVDALRW